MWLGITSCGEILWEICVVKRRKFANYVRDKSRQKRTFLHQVRAAMKCVANVRI